MTSKAQRHQSRQRLLLSILSQERQRHLLAILDDEDLPLTERDLAVQLAAVDAQKRPQDVTDEERTEAHHYLHHVALPKAEAAGSLVHGPNGVQLSARFDDILATLDLPVPDSNAPNSPRWDVLATVFERPYRRELLRIIWSAEQPCSIQLLARELEQTETDQRLPRDESSIELVLHHVDLPKLAALNLIEYDETAKKATQTPLLSTVLRE